MNQSKGEDRSCTPSLTVKDQTVAEYFVCRFASKTALYLNMSLIT